MEPCSTAAQASRLLAVPDRSIEYAVGVGPGRANGAAGLRVLVVVDDDTPRMLTVLDDRCINGYLGAPAVRVMG